MPRSAAALAFVSAGGKRREQMPAFGRVYKPEDLHDVATYVVEQLVK